MSNPVSTLRLQDALRECERNAYHLSRALNMLNPILPMTLRKMPHWSILPLTQPKA